MGLLIGLYTTLMPETYDDARERIRQRREDLEQDLRDQVFRIRSGAQLDREDSQERWQRVKTIMTSTPAGIGTSTTGAGDGQGGEYIDPGLDVDLENLDQRGLLEVIARGQLSALSALLDVADFTSPPGNVTVSGSEVIDVPDDPQLLFGASKTGDVGTRTIYIRSSTDNQAPIAFGDNAVSPNDGFILRPGESITLDIDLRKTQIYMASDRVDQVVHLLGVY